MPHTLMKKDRQIARFEEISPREMKNLHGGSAGILQQKVRVEQKVRFLPDVQIRDLELNQATNTLH